MAASRNIEKLLEQAKEMPTSELYRSELIALYNAAGQNIFDCLCKGWEAGYAAGYNRAMQEIKKTQKEGSK